MEVRVTPPIAAAVRLAIHIAVAVALFSIINPAAVVLNLVINLCEKSHWAPVWAVEGMRGLEFLLWGGDVLCFLMLVAVEVWGFCLAMWNSRGG